MFVLVRNNFLVDGSCHYVDEHENTIFIKRVGENTYKAKIRLAQCDISFEPVIIDINDKNSEAGVVLPIKNIQSENGMDFERENKKLINEISNILSRWWQMLRDIQNFIDAQKSHMSEKEMMHYVAKLIQYEETSNIVRALFGNMIMAPKS